jgi:beta-hydroxylase
LNILPLAVGLSALAAFVAGSLAYVYAWRGRTRYAGFNEYVRKGWPIFSPLNCMLYLCTRARAGHSVMDLADFPELDPIREHWTTIRDEAVAVYEQAYFDAPRDQANASHYDLGFRTFYKHGWSKFYLTWYGYTHASAQRLMPRTVALLESIPSVNGSMLTILPPGGRLTRHADPLACSLRYHLGLQTPNDDACFINVDGQTCSWRDGEALLFDETFLHYAENETDRPRLILMCDVERPMSFAGRLVNCFYKALASLTVVPNTDEDRRGLVNALFAGLAPFNARMGRLKATDRRLYKILKWTINCTLLLLLVGIVAGALYLLGLLVGGLASLGR